MMNKVSKPKIKISVIDPKGHRGCYRGHQIVDTFDFETERGKLCPVVMHVAFFILISFNMGVSSRLDGTIVFCCRDVDVINVFQIEVQRKTD